MNKKIAVIGAGNVGASCAMYLAEANFADIVMVDIAEGVPQGKALDLTQAGPVRGYNATVTGTNNYADIVGVSIVIVTAGFPRKPGMTREDLLTMNADIVGSVAKNIKQYAPDSFVIIVSNPLDLMTYHAFKVTGFPSNRVMGQAGVLDSIRFRAFVAMELGVAMTDTQTLVLGGHGDTMVPLPRYSTVSGIPIAELIPAERIKAICDRATDGGGEIGRLLKTGSAFYAPAAASVDMCKAIFSDEKRVVCVSAHLTGQYGINNIYIGVPVVLGARGIEKIIELSLTADEQAALKKSADTYTEQLKILKY
ncbi:MAG: malate dehydrogenase [candidate division Zixibacteria bacterium]|nr:malate dehydrogenase [candidate division Zixibacteria bacterium]